MTDTLMVSPGDYTYFIESVNLGGEPLMTGAVYIYRKSGEDPAKMAGMAKPSNRSWTDSVMAPGTSYLYTMAAEFKDGTRILVNDGILVSTM